MIVLIVEDEPFTAMALEMELQGAGHRVLGPAATVGEAEALIVDANLQGGGDSVALSRRLMAQGTKVLFTSGQTATARANRDAAWGLITKPYDPRTVLLSLEVVQNLADGRPPERMPMRLELFAPAEGRPVTATER